MGLIALVLALGAIVFFVGLKSFPTAASGLGSAVSGFIGNVLTAPTPKPSVVPIADAPTLTLPAEPYTSESTVDLQVTVPKALASEPRLSDPGVPGIARPVAEPASRGPARRPTCQRPSSRSN